MRARRALTRLVDRSAAVGAGLAFRFRRLEDRLEYVYGEFDDDETYQRVGRAMGHCRQAVFYLEIPPALFAPVVMKLSEAELTAGPSLSYMLLVKPRMPQYTSWIGARNQ